MSPLQWVGRQLAKVWLLFLPIKNTLFKYTCIFVGKMHMFELKKWREKWNRLMQLELKEFDPVVLEWKEINPTLRLSSVFTLNISMSLHLTPSGHHMWYFIISPKKYIFLKNTKIYILYFNKNTLWYLKLIYAYS